MSEFLRRFMFVILLCPSFLLAVGCGILPGTREEFDRTPAGWHVHWIENGTITSGLRTREELFTRFDATMEAAIPWCATKVGLPVDYVRKTIRDRDALYTLHDDCMFRVDPGSVDAPTATWASGATDGRTHTRIAYYLWRPVKSNATPVDPLLTEARTLRPWTIHQSPTNSDEIIFSVEEEGHYYPALDYELHWQFTEIP